MPHPYNRPCPHCGALAGYGCTRPNGGPAKQAHAARSNIGIKLSDADRQMLLEATDEIMTILGDDVVEFCVDYVRPTGKFVADYKKMTQRMPKPPGPMTVLFSIFVGPFRQAIEKRFSHITIPVHIATVRDYTVNALLADWGNSRSANVAYDKKQVNIYVVAVLMQILNAMGQQVVVTELDPTALQAAVHRDIFGALVHEYTHMVDVSPRVRTQQVLAKLLEKHPGLDSSVIAALAKAQAPELSRDIDQGIERIARTGSFHPYPYLHRFTEQRAHETQLREIARSATLANPTVDPADMVRQLLSGVVAHHDVPVKVRNRMARLIMEGYQEAQQILASAS